MLVIGDNEGVFARRSTYTKKAEMCISTQATKKQFNVLAKIITTRRFMCTLKSEL